MTQTEQAILYSEVSQIWMEPTGKGTSLLISVEHLPADVRAPIFLSLSNVQETIGYLELECVGAINGKALLQAKGLRLANAGAPVEPSQILQFSCSQQEENSKDKYSL
ncbi:hypothetical protein GS535_04280 [Saccharibacter sp. EH611]|uniref:hypothetical protein n=1 Tax=unclassified Saccharibacter TaxID=2648722 RepID=UPI001324F636|nr:MULTISPECIES: hypothetical protein [unclassified Saccharibacter]MXV35773.1 hypothetical protein [Saccharibacter sp. EH611]MXV65923.1 hypothetical protein [Saccharibacter sp. EH60]